MSSNKMSLLEPVPLGTWQSSVLISVKLLTFQVDVRFFWQGSVLINVTSFCTCGHFGLKWHPPRNFVHPPKTVVLSTFFPNPGDKGGCLTLPLLQRISKQRSPQMKKGVAFDFLARRHSSWFPIFCTCMYICT